MNIFIQFFFNFFFILLFFKNLIFLILCSVSFVVELCTEMQEYHCFLSLNQIQGCLLMLNNQSLSRERPQLSGSDTRAITEVQQRRAQLVLRWEPAWEPGRSAATIGLRVNFGCLRNASLRSTLTSRSKNAEYS